MTVTAFDHVAIPTDQPETMLAFYRALGFQAPSPDEWRASGLPYFSIQFGDNKINVHAPARPGCGDFCFVWSGTLEGVREMLARAGAPVELGPVERVGGGEGGKARGQSIYSRDPDGNLLEFIVY